MKIIKLRSNLTVILNDGSILTNTECDDILYSKVIALQNNEEEVKQLLIPEYFKQVAKYEELIELHTKELEVVEQIKDDVKKCSLVTLENDSFYIRSISDLTVPKELALALIAAEKEEDKILIETYSNFWLLSSLNPDAEARKNLFWFLGKYGMNITRSGLFVGYRNVDVYCEGNRGEEFNKFVSSNYIRIKNNKKSPKNYFVIREDGNLTVVKIGSQNFDSICIGNLYELYNNLSGADTFRDETPIYTDQHTGKTRIKIGKMVSMPREDCDPVQTNTCSRGFHLGGKSWLENQGQNYYGTKTLMVLVSPSNVVAVPPVDDYGKMRVCAYFPIKIVEWKNGRISDDEAIDMGFEDDFMEQICYEGEVNNEDKGLYKLEIPVKPELNRVNILEKLDTIKKSLKKYAIVM